MHVGLRLSGIVCYNKAYIQVVSGYNPSLSISIRDFLSIHSSIYSSVPIWVKKARFYAFPLDLSF